MLLFSFGYFPRHRRNNLESYSTVRHYLRKLRRRFVEAGKKFTFVISKTKLESTCFSEFCEEEV